jgi:hypothetical protein
MKRSMQKYMHTIIVYYELYITQHELYITQHVFLYQPYLAYYILNLECLYAP